MKSRSTPGDSGAAWGAMNTGRPQASTALGGVSNAGAVSSRAFGFALKDQAPPSSRNATTTGRPFTR
jgi:hypothetical protein